MTGADRFPVPGSRMSLTRRHIVPEFFAQHEMEPAKVDTIAAHLARGGRVPPVVVARYGAKVMPLDGHHRLAAHKRLGRLCPALECRGAALENLACRVGSFEADRLILAAAADIIAQEAP
jgi:hypothetical protein